MVDPAHVEELKASLPELPNAKLKRYMKDFGLPRFDANLLVENPGEGGAV